MSLYGMENFAYGTVADTFDASQTTFSMSSGHTGRFTTFPCMAVLYNITDYNSPHEAFYEGASADAEIIEIVSKSGDTFDVVKRGQDGTSGISTTSGATYRIAVIASRSQWSKVCRAQPDAAGPFDAILAGTAGSVTEALARFVKDVPGEDAPFSIQGSDQSGDITSILLGDITTPNDVRLERLKTTVNELGLYFNAVKLLHAEANGALGFHRTSLAETVSSLQLGAKVGIDSLLFHSDASATISSNALTVTTPEVRVSGEGSSDDDLETITLSPTWSGKKAIIILRYNSAGVITVKDGVGNITLSYGDFRLGTTKAMLALKETASGFTELYRTPWVPEASTIESQTSGTGGGGFASGSWQTRTLNSDGQDSEFIMSRSGNALTFIPGTYYAWISAPGNGVDEHQIRFRNTTDASTAIMGTAELAPSGTQTRSWIHGKEFSVPNGTTKTFEVQHRCTTSNLTDGFGVSTAFGEAEVFTVARFLKID